MASSRRKRSADYWVGALIDSLSVFARSGSLGPAADRDLDPRFTEEARRMAHLFAPVGHGHRHPAR